MATSSDAFPRMVYRLIGQYCEFTRKPLTFARIDRHRKRVLAAAEVIWQTSARRVPRAGHPSGRSPRDEAYRKVARDAPVTHVAALTGINIPRPLQIPPRASSSRGCDPECSPSRFPTDASIGTWGYDQPQFAQTAARRRSTHGLYSNQPLTPCGFSHLYRVLQP